MTFPYLLALILAELGQLADCLTTQYAISLGAHEANPLMVWVVVHPWVEYPLKLGLPLFVLFVCKKLFSPRKIGLAPIIFFALGGFGAAIWNPMQCQILTTMGLF